MAHRAQDDETEKQSIQEAPVRLYRGDEEGWEEEEEAEHQDREQNGVDHRGPGLGQIPEDVEVLDGGVGDRREEGLWEQAEEEEGQRDPHDAVDDTEELGLVGLRVVHIGT